MATVSLAQVPQQGRVIRRPVHNFHVRHRPWQIQPIMIAPVIPGETMRNALLQSRVVTDPIKNPLIGWWIEYFLFYVKHRDLHERDHFEGMMLDPNHDLSELNESASTDYYHAGGSINWTKRCLRRVVEEYFRDEGEEWDDYTIGNLPAANISSKSWLDSVVLHDHYQQPDLDVDLDGDDTIMASEVDAAMRQYQLMRAHGMTDMSYEDYLRTFGIRPGLIENHKPELIRYVKNWSYPTNTVNPENGEPSSAVSWSIAERADKDRFFSEPGFILGVTVCRPKLYLSNQTGSAAAMLNDAWSWLPAIMRNDPATSLRPQAAQTGPLPHLVDSEEAPSGYWVDIRDLFLYGDQFVNFSLSEDDAGLVALPAPDLQKNYAAASDADALFSGASKLCRQDGVVTMMIAGTQVDHTP